MRLNRLSARAVAVATTAGMYADGGGLYLRVDGGSRAWVYRFKRAGRSRYMGLGPLSIVGLAEARQKAAEARRLVWEGKDPIAVRDAERAAQRVLEARAITFRQCAEGYIDAHRAGWRSAQHAAQWAASLETHVYPVLGELPVAAVDTGLVMRVLEAIWSSRPVTAGRLRGRIEAVLDWARTRGYCSNENPARWKGHLQYQLVAKRKLHQVKHLPALPYQEIGGFMVSLAAEQGGVSAPALQFLILTAARTGEVLGATWSEVDLAAGIWTIAGERMKGGKAHRVPLSDAALALLHAMNGVRISAYVFPGLRPGSPLGARALLDLLERMGRKDITAHGFRSTFRDWCAECTNYPREVCEMALAHAVGNQVEAAYRRGDLLEKRRQLMDEWACYCAIPPTKSGEIVPLRRAE
jgi:integrase